MQISKQFVNYLHSHECVRSRRFLPESRVRKRVLVDTNSSNNSMNRGNYYKNYHNMQLFLHLGTDLEYFKLLNEGFLLPSGKEQKEIAAFFSRHFPGELAENISPQYEVNFQAIKELKRKFGPDVFKKIDGIYYGSDNCEYLIPHVHEVKKALEYFAEFNKNFPPHAPRSFTLVTPYVGDKMLEHLKKTLTYLHEVSLKKPIEIVVNDL